MTINHRIRKIEQALLLNSSLSDGIELLGDITIIDFLEDTAEAKINYLIERFSIDKLPELCRMFEKRTGKKCWTELFLLSEV